HMAVFPFNGEGVVMMDQGLEKYRHLKEYMDGADIDLRKLLRMVDSILEEVESPHIKESNPELCLSISDIAVRIRSLLSARLAALEGLVTSLREHGIGI